ncbi:MAG: hypothetical protein K0R90_1367 [Oscillospiraceae bacterium]|nr:hypothetical protein [Oscillospiraceae bacterium]
MPIDITNKKEAAEEMWQIGSPDKSIRIIFTLNQNGELFYAVMKDKKIVLAFAPLGIQTSMGDFSKELIFTSASPQTEINETYSVVSRKKAEYINHAVEQMLSFSKSNMIFNVIARAYNDGIAFRYIIKNSTNQDTVITISGENTEFNIPAQSKVWHMPHDGGGAFSYEGLFSENRIENVTGDQTIPLLYETKEGLFALITEAHLSGEYIGSMVKVHEKGRLCVSFTPQQGTNQVNTIAPFESPWRVAVIGTLNQIIQNTMVENLSPAPNAEKNYSWIEPGVSSWNWLVGEKEMQRNPLAIKKYIDFASEMGWKYFIMDEGWQPESPPGSDSKYSGYFEWFADIQKYAEQNGIGLIAWVFCDDLNTSEKRKSRLEDWKSHGFKGIKVDFFDRETQDRMKLYEGIYKDCMALDLVVNVHGANKPTGEIRTYPNVLTREGIHGQEQGDIKPFQYTIIPFTRTAVGPADVTETVFPRGNSATAGFQIALSVLIQSGLHCLASSVENYRNSPAYSFYQQMPVIWDETLLIDAYPGAFVTLVRRNENNWYAASVTVDSRVAILTLDFLDEGEYTAFIYKDGQDDRTNLCLEETTVTRRDILEIPMKTGGGCAVKIIKR